MSRAASHLSFDGRINRYLGQIKQFPMLEAAEEHSLAKRARDEDDADAADRLVTSHLRLVAKIAHGYRGYGLPLSDLISEGTLGILKAVKRFDPDRGFRFTTYATWWIHAEIRDYVLRSWSLVKMGTTAAQKKLFFNLRRLKAQLRAADEGDLTPADVERIATTLEVSPLEVVHMNRRLAAHDSSLNIVLTESDSEWQDAVADEQDSQEERLAERETEQLRRSLTRRAIGQLTEREREIITDRWLRAKPLPFARLADRYGLSPERIRQIELRALAKMRKLVAPSRQPLPASAALQAAKPQLWGHAHPSLATA